MIREIRYELEQKGCKSGKDSLQSKNQTKHGKGNWTINL